MGQSIQSRVQEAVDTLCGGNKSEFCRRINRPAQAIKDIVGGKKSAPGYDLLHDILASDLGISPTWLLMGEGPMLIEAEEQETIEGETSNPGGNYAQELKGRLIEFARTQYDKGQTRFEDYCGLSHGSIASIKVKGPTADMIMKISTRCPELNLNWLFRGEAGGPMLNPTGEEIIERPSRIDKASLKINDVHDNQVVMIGNWEELSNIMESVISKVIVERK